MVMMVNEAGRRSRRGAPRMESNRANTKWVARAKMDWSRQVYNMIFGFPLLVCSCARVCAYWFVSYEFDCCCCLAELNLSI